MFTKLLDSVVPTSIVLVVGLLVGCTQELSEPSTEIGSVTWFDDYYTVQYIDEETIAIGEPRYHQQNYSYLLLGSERALLIDTGPGIRDIKPVIDSLTNLPVTVTQTHFHYDHVGNHTRFHDIAVADLPILRQRVEDGELIPSMFQHLGFVERIERPQFKVTQWWEEGQSVDLGERTVTLLHTPGHAATSVVIVDSERDYIFGGDFLCPGPNLSALPGSNIDDYLSSTQRLIQLSTSNTRILAGHRDKASIEDGAPTLERQDLVDFEQTLTAIINGTANGKGFYINLYQVNDRIDFIINRGF